MACISLALGLTAAFKDTNYPIVAKWIAEAFIEVAILIFWSTVTECRKPTNV
jgi:putative membrane protein